MLQESQELLGGPGDVLGDFWRSQMRFRGFQGVPKVHRGASGGFNRILGDSGGPRGFQEVSESLWCASWGSSDF